MRDFFLLAKNLDHRIYPNFRLKFTQTPIAFFQLPGGCKDECCSFKLA